MLNRAVAIAETKDASAGLAAREALKGDARISECKQYWAARAELLARNGEAHASAQAYGCGGHDNQEPRVAGNQHQRSGLVSGRRWAQHL